MLNRKNLATLICTFVVGLVSFSGNGFAQSTSLKDIQGHWAKEQISEWTNQGLVKGYSDGTFKPNATITRAEFMTMVNKAFNLSEKAQDQYKDVLASDWFSPEIAKAKAAGYISGYEDGTMRPKQQVTRQEAAVMLSKVLKLDVSNQAALSGFKDQSKIPSWSKGPISTIASHGFMSGYPDQTFQPQKSITRAEAVATLYKALKPKEASGIKVKSLKMDKAGTYGDIAQKQIVAGDAVIEASGVMLQNTEVQGNLVISAAVGEGDVTLKNISVKGNVFVQGGGPNSVVIDNSTLAKLTVNKAAGNVRIVAKAKTSIQQTELQSGAKLEEMNLSAEGFTNVTVSDAITTQKDVVLAGQFETITIAGSKVKVDIIQGKVNELELKPGKMDIQIQLNEEVSIKTLILESPAEVKGKGSIEKAEIKVSGSSFEYHPDVVVKADDISATLPSSATGGAGGGGGGAGGGTGQTQVVPVASNVSISGSTFSGSGTGLSATISNTDQILDIIADLNTNTKIELVSVLDKGNQPVSLFGVNTQATVSAGSQKSINLINILGLSSLDTGTPGVSAKTVSSFINGAETGTFTIKLKLTNANDITKFVEYNLRITVTE